MAFSGIGAKVRVVDNLSTGFEENIAAVRSHIHFIKGDLSDPAVCREAVSGVDYVLHQAAIPSVPRSINDPIEMNRSNVAATLNLGRGMQPGKSEADGFRQHLCCLW